MKLEFALESPNFSTGEDQSPKWWIPRPYTGVFLADVFWLLIVGAFDRHILPSIVGGSFPFTLLTPWLIVTFVVAPHPICVVLLILGGLFLETSSAAPRGFYLTGYWVVFAVLAIARKTLSWRHGVPWLVTLFFAGFFISNFETLFILLSQNSNQLDFFYFIRQVVRVTCCVFVGMAFAQRWMVRFKGEGASP